MEITIMMLYTVLLALAGVFYGVNFVAGQKDSTMDPMTMSLEMTSIWPLDRNETDDKPGDKRKPPKIGGISFDKKGIDMKRIKSIKGSDLKSAVSTMTAEMKLTMCQSVMNGGADRAIMREMKGAGLDCIAAMKRDPTFKPMGGQAAIMVEQMRDEKPPAQWSESDWSLVLKQMPKALKGDDLGKIPPKTLKKLIQSGDISGKSFDGKTQKRALKRQLESAYGDPSNFSSSDLAEMGSLILTMDKKSLKKIAPDQMKAAAASFRDMEFNDPTQKATIGKQLIEALGKSKADKWTPSEVADADQYLRSYPALIGKLSDAAITGSLGTLGNRTTDKRGAVHLCRRLKSMKDFKDPSKVDDSKLSELGQLAKGMGIGFLSQLRKDSIQGALPTLSKVAFARGEARELMKQIKGTPSSYSASNLTELGNLVTGLDPTDLAQIPASALADAITDLSDNDFSKSQCRAIVKRVKQAGSDNLKKMGKLMAKCMTPSDMDTATLDDLGLNCTDSTEPSFTPDKATAKILFKKIREQFGSPNSTSTTFTLSCIKNWGRVAALGMDAEDFKDFPDNGDLASIFEEFAKFEKDMHDSQTKGIAYRLRKFLDMDNLTAVAAHDSSIIEQVGKFLKHFDDADLEKFNSSLKPDIARKLGECNLDKMPISEISRLKKFAFKNILNEDGDIIDASSASTLDSALIGDLGNLFRGLEISDVKKMTGDAISANIGSMQDRIRGRSVKEALIERAISQDSSFFDTTDNIIASAGLFGGLSASKLAAIKDSVLGEALSDASEMMETRASKDLLRDNAGFKDEVSEADESTMSENIKAFVLKAFAAYLNDKTSSRKKRSATAITCTDIQTLGSNADSLTTAQIQSLTTSEFTDCTETLGDISGWTSAQLNTLIAEAKAAYGNSPSSWSASKVKLIGSMGAGLTATEISTLTISAADTLSSMGNSKSLTSEQLSAGYNRFLSQVRSDKPASVTGDDLIAIGAFACGATSSQIESITSANYKTAASSIGGLSSCSDTQLSSYAKLAKTAYGAVTTWDSTTMTTIGSVIGGLSSSEIGSLSKTQIAQISATSMSLISAGSIVGFTKTQISDFTLSQANSVTKTQQSALSASQLSALLAAGATRKVSDSGAAAPVHTTILLLFPLLAIYL